MKRLAFFAVAAATAAVGVLVACGGDDGNVGGTTPDGGGGGGEAAPPPNVPPGPPPGPLPPATAGQGKDFCDKTYVAFFNAYLACCTAQDKTRQEYALLGLLTIVGQACETELEASIAKGRLSIDPKLAADCESAFAGLVSGGLCGKTSDQLGAQLNSAQAAECKPAIIGLQAIGQPCSGDYECVTGATCVGYTSKADGTCKAPPAIGEACGKGSEEGGTGLNVNLNFGDHPGCATGAYCSIQKCVAQKADGVFCGADNECLNGKCHEDKCGSTGPTDVGTECRGNSDCKSGLYCQRSPDGGTIGSCDTKKAAGAPCRGSGFNSTGECKGVCDVPDGGDAGSCAAFCGSG
jgi:hypothetical protein